MTVWGVASEATWESEARRALWGTAGFVLSGRGCAPTLGAVGALVSGGRNHLRGGGIQLPGSDLIPADGARSA